MPRGATLTARGDKEWKRMCMLSGKAVWYDSVTLQERVPCFVDRVYDDATALLVDEAGTQVKDHADPRRIQRRGAGEPSVPGTRHGLGADAGSPVRTKQRPDLQAGHAYHEGERVEYNSHSAGQWVPAVVKKLNTNGTVWILLDDGRESSAIDQGRIRAPLGSEPEQEPAPAPAPDGIVRAESEPEPAPESSIPEAVTPLKDPRRAARAVKFADFTNAHPRDATKHVAISGHPDAAYNGVYQRDGTEDGFPVFKHTEVAFASGHRVDAQLFRKRYRYGSEGHEAVGWFIGGRNAVSDGSYVARLGTDTDGRLRLEIDSMSVKQLREFIYKADMSFADCIEKTDLQARAHEAAVKEGAHILQDLEVPVGDWQWKCGSPSQHRTVADSRRLYCILSIKYRQVDDSSNSDSDEDGDGRYSRIPSLGAGVQNQPGQWDAMISYTQRNTQAKLLAAEVYATLRERGKSVWLDIKMKKLNAHAMQEAAQNSKCIIAVVTGVEREGDPEDTAYFRRKYCMNELRWARKAGVTIQPVVQREDKERIGEFLDQAPDDLQPYLRGIDFKALDRISPAIWKTCIDELLTATSLDGARAHEPMRTDDEVSMQRNSPARHVFTRHADTPDTIKIKMIQGYCNMRFGRQLNTHEAMLVSRYMSDAEPPIETREDPRFSDVFDILDHAPGSEPEPEDSSPSRPQRAPTPNRWKQGMACEVHSASGGGWCRGLVTATSRDVDTGRPTVTVTYETPSEVLEKILPHDSAFVRKASREDPCSSRPL